MRTVPFTPACYLALGDSISIDQYPALDWQELHGLPSPAPGLGAASLLFRNDDEAWPDFRGRDLETLFPGIALRALATDGGTATDVLDLQLPQLEVDARPVLVTLTVGGNDLLQVLASGQRPALRHSGEILGRIQGILDRLEGLFPSRVIVMGTVYDPSDGGPTLMGMRLGREERQVLESLNDGIRRLASGHRGVLLADIAAHFAGHGLAAPPAERWYWPHMLIEPSARGASEVRRLWLQALEQAEATQSVADDSQRR